MPYIDDATWEEMISNLRTAQANLKYTKEQNEIISKRLDELEKRRDEQFRSPGYWDQIILDFCEYAGIRDEDPLLDEHFLSFVGFVNDKYPMCMDLVFVIWGSWFG